MIVIIIISRSGAIEYNINIIYTICAVLDDDDGFCRARQDRAGQNVGGREFSSRIFFPPFSSHLFRLARRRGRATGTEQYSPETETNRSAQR